MGKLWHLHFGYGFEVSRIGIGPNYIAITEERADMGMVKCIEHKLGHELIDTIKEGCGARKSL